VAQLAVGRQHYRPVDLEGEIHFAIASQERLNRDLEPTQESVLFLQNNLSFILVSENLFIEERNMDNTGTLSQHLLGEAAPIKSGEWETQNLIPFRLLTFIYTSPLNHVCFGVVDYLHFHERFNFRCTIHVRSQVH
jgi:hypothetical protein